MSLSGTTVFDTARGAHLPGNELKIGRLFLRKPFRAQQSVSQVFFHCPSMQRFVSRRSSSSVDLDSSSLGDVRTERAVIDLSVGLSWPPVKRRRSAGRQHILHLHELPHGVRLQRQDWWQPGDAIARPLTHEEITHTSTPCPAPAASATPAAALVEDEPSSSAAKRRKVQVDPFVRDWFLDMSCHWRAERQWGIPRCLGEVRRLCPRMFDGINQNTPYRWKRSATAPHGRKSLL